MNETTKKPGLFSRLIDHVTGCMGPIIPVLIAGGLVKLIVLILTMTGLLAEGTTTEQVLSLIGDAPLYFLPMILAYTSAVQFHVNPVIAMSAVGAMLSPTYVELASSAEKLTFAGLPFVKATYAYSTIPVILLVAAMIWIEKGVHKLLPKAVDDVLAPLVILLISSLVGFLAIGPLGNLIGNLLVGIIDWLQIHAPAAAWAVFAATTPLQVITGTHWVFIATCISQLGAVGVDNGILVGFFILSLAMAGTDFAVFLKTKSASAKKTALSCGITILLTGVSEPSIFGVALKYKRPLITTMLACAIAGLFQGIVTIHAYIYAFPAIPSCLMFSGEPGNLVKALIAGAIALASAFVLTFLFGGKCEEPDAKKEADA